MTRRGRVGLLAAAMLALSCSACSTAVVTVTASRSSNPVMFGPVRAVSRAPVAVAPAAMGGTPFDYRQKMRIWFFTGAGGVPSLTVYTTGTDNDWLSKDLGSFPVRCELYDKPGLLDWTISRATAEDTDVRVDVTSLRCGGFVSFFLAGKGSGSGCELEGFVPKP